MPEKPGSQTPFVYSSDLTALPWTANGELAADFRRRTRISSLVGMNGTNSRVTHVLARPDPAVID